MARFPGFPAEGLQFLRQLKKNNKREWFQPRKEIFEEKVKAPMTELVGAVNEALGKAAPAYVTEPSKAIYRIYRDTRFSKDKTPYKTHIAATFRHRSLGKHASAGLYFSVSPDEIEVAAGVYMPGPDELRILRHMLAEEYEKFRGLTGSKTVKKLMGDLQGEQLARIPKGFAADHPGEDVLRRKQWYFYVTLDGVNAGKESLYGELWKRFEVMMPYLEFMNAPLLAGRKREMKAAAFDR